ncbi:hypothetical protein [Nostoc phage A1]|nr:hypothetical protein [Nostoc phage A1]
MYHYHVDFTCGKIRNYGKISIKRKILVSTYEVCMMEIHNQIRTAYNADFDQNIIIHNFQLLEHN